MFKRLAPEDGTQNRAVDIVVNGRTIAAQEGDSVAAALLAAGELHFRMSPTADKPRGPYCLMGVCFECLVTIDGRANRQACMTAVRPGMTVTIAGAASHD
jgi:predicted molibdopterin-dependent oxidoreductase YjgC